MFKTSYKPPISLSTIYMLSDGKALCALLFEDNFLGAPDEPLARLFDIAEEKADIRVFEETKRWLDIYFGGREPDFTPEIGFLDFISPFTREVLGELVTVGYGRSVTYGELAKRIAEKMGKEKMSAQAIGGAVGRNPVCIILPCHRVLGAKHRLGGFSGGIHNKISLLNHENISFS